MKISSSGTSIIESMIVLLIVVTGITGVYGLMNASQKLANSTESRIEAIQIARDGLEAFTNIRDTNWLRFAADRANCWNVLNYNASCIGSATTTYDIRLSATQWIRLSRNWNNQFFIGIQNHWGTNTFDNTTYRNRFRVQKDTRWFYTQAWGTNFTPIFTREIQIDYLNAAWVSQWSTASNNPKMKVTAIVQWNDPASSTPQRLEMSTILTNWKN
jgi:hypothetical protein